MILIYKKYIDYKSKNKFTHMFIHVYIRLYIKIKYLYFNEYKRTSK